MVHYGGMSRTISFLGIVIMVSYLSLYMGVAGSLIKGILNEPNRSPITFLWIPVIWVGKDLVQEKIVSGFPWCFAGYSQHGNTYFAQLAEWGGIHLLTFLVITVNVLLYLLIKRKDWKLGAALAVLFLCVYTVGYFLYRSSEAQIRDLPVHTAGILQPNTSNDQRFGWDEKNEKLEAFFNDSAALKAQGAEFVIWPEFSIPIYPLQNKYYFKKIMDYVKENGPLLAGFTDFQGRREIYNSLILFEKDGVKKYDKVHLTPFGEYLLFREVLFFVERITQEIGDFTPGAELHNLSFNGHAVAPPICYELIFPELVRDLIAKGAKSL